MEPVVEVRSLRKRFGSRLALDSVDLTVGRGEVVGLLGPNGSGKTTLLSILAGSIRSTAGEVRVAGVDVRSRPAEVRLRVGFVPQEPALYDELSPHESLLLAARLFGISDGEAKARTTELLSRVGLTAVADEANRVRSGGQRQRLSVALGLVHNPSVLLLDEPTAGLDPPAARELRSLLSDLRRAERAIVVATHDVEEARSLCDRLVLLRDGRVAANGSFDDVRRELSKLFGEEAAGP